MEIINNKERVKLCAALLANNIKHIQQDLHIEQGLTYPGRLGNMIIYMVLPRYHKGEIDNYAVAASSALERLTLLKIMAEQSAFLVEQIRGGDPEFSVWVENLLFKFLKIIAPAWLQDGYMQQIH